jgi:hypothetical protein
VTDEKHIERTSDLPRHSDERQQRRAEARSHPSDNLLERYSMGRLTEAEMAPLKAHLVICRECRNRGVLMDCDVAAIREALKGWREEKIQ